MSLVEIERLRVAFGGAPAVDDVSLAVAPGEIVGLLGANGAGKTTTIRAALGLQRPSAGRVRLVGQVPSRRARADVGYVPQSLGLWPDLTVAQNLAFVARAFGGSPPALPGGLTAVRDVPVAALSLGLRRRVAFEAALGHGPRLLVLDEPTSGVGPLERTHLWDRVHAAREAGAGVLVTTHHMGEAEQCDRVVVLMGGRVLVSGTIASLLAERETVVVTTGDWRAALARLDERFAGVALAGGTLRVPDASEPEVAAALQGLPATVDTAPASFEEVFVGLGRHA